MSTIPDTAHSASRKVGKGGPVWANLPSGAGRMQLDGKQQVACSCAPGSACGPSAQERAHCSKRTACSTDTAPRTPVHTPGPIPTAPQDPLSALYALPTTRARSLRSLAFDGHKGWPQKAPFDAVIVTCAPEQIPRPLVKQLKEGGRMIIPVGRAGVVQKLVRGVKTGRQLKTEEVMLVRFVPMVTGDD